MTPAALIFLLATPFWAALLHAAFGHLGILKKKSPQSVVILVLAVTVGTVVGGVALMNESTGAVLFSLFIAPLLAHVYFHFFNMSETARRIRILLEIRNETFSLASNEAGYSPESLVRVRLERLKQLGQVKVIDDKVHGKRSWLLVAAIAVRAHEKLLFPHRN